MYKHNKPKENFFKSKIKKTKKTRNTEDANFFSKENTYFNTGTIQYTTQNKNK